LAESRLGRADDTRRAAAELLAVAQSLEGEFEGRPTEREHHLAWALHFSGRRDEALAAASGYLTQLERMDEGIQQDRRVRVAELYAQMRETDKCVALLTELLKSPTRLTLPALQREAIWAPVRDEPRFQALLQDPATAKPL
jgi:hypothetical protein